MHVVTSGVRNVDMLGHFHNFRLFELSEDIYARSVLLVLF